MRTTLVSLFAVATLRSASIGEENVPPLSEAQLPRLSISERSSALQSGNPMPERLASIFGAILGAGVVTLLSQKSGPSLRKAIFSAANRAFER